jgi:trigger factor
MAITTEVVPLEDDRVRLDVAVPKDEVDKKMDRTMRRLGREIRVPGFRPGKVPANVVMQRFGRDAIVDQMLRDSLVEWYAEAVVETGIRPVDDPDVDLPDDGTTASGLTFTATVQLRPTVTLGQYKGLEVGKATPEIPEGALDEEIERLRGLAARLEEVERAAEQGDFVTIDFDGTVDGEALASASARDYLVEIGGTRLVGGFSERLVGMSPGESKTFPLDYPDSDGRDELAGKTVKYTVTMKGVQAKVLPELTDELATQVSEFDTIAELRADIETRLQAQAQDQVDELFRRSVIDAAVLGATVNVPKVMIDQRVEGILHDFSHQLPQGVSMADYLRISGRSMEQARTELGPEAEMALKRELVVEAIAKAEAISSTDEEVEVQVRNDALAAGRDPDALLVELRNAGGFETLREDMVMRATVDFLIEQTNAIPIELAEARERLWTPEKAGEPVAPDGGLWTPDQPAPKKASKKGGSKA